MPLPKITQPKFQITIPSTGQKTEFTPFTVREEKILLIAQESKDLDQVILSIKQIIENCIQDDINVSSLAIFDIEYLMIHLRSQSVNNLVEFKIKDPETEEEIKIELDINDIELKRDPEHEKTIQVTDEVYLIMGYPKIDQIKKLKNTTEENKNEVLFDMMMSCIEKVVDGDEVYELKDFTSKEVEEFVNSLTNRDLNNIKKFFDTMPTLRYETKYTRSDGVEKTFVAEGTETFFI